MDSFKDLIDMYRIKYLLKEEEQKKDNLYTILLYVLGAIVAAISAAAIVYGLYRFFKPDQVDDFDDEFEDDFDDDFFDDEEMANGTGA